MTAPATPNQTLVALRCPHCASESIQAEALLVVDGPGICFSWLAREDAQPGDVCGRCPKCGRIWCARVLRPAA